jgi:hypothetical protein
LGLEVTRCFSRMCFVATTRNAKVLSSICGGFGLFPPCCALREGSTLGQAIHLPLTLLPEYDMAVAQKLLLTRVCVFLASTRSALLLVSPHLLIPLATHPPLP